ncbi:MCE family protein [Nocardia panacis]|uniref:MCE family protein n=1 Tax=Nocardia panacis TaxID=2340916 RepID=A0A3A4KAG1_9NOCA|nr:MCE family protein [Nocardia panacis]RJO78698.1 MCE family protein [Nocardia panacis]
MRGRRIRLSAVAVAVTIGACGCSWDGLNSLPLPGTEGTGAGSWRVRIQMPNVTTLTRNSPVRVHDVTVGSVSGIELEGWHALVTVSLNPGVDLPANTVAAIGQTSLLGSNHLELSAPTNVAPQGKLRDGDLIPLERAGAYPTTEQVLSSLSMVVSGGGVAQLETITRELDTALTGRTDAIRDLLPQINELTTTLDRQTGDIVAAIEGLDRFSGVLAQQKQRVAAAIEDIHPALTVLADRRETLTKTIVALGGLSDVVQRIVDNSGADLRADLRNLWPVLQQLADTGNNLTEVLKVLLTFPFPMKYLDHAIKGDYLNLFITVDLRAARLDSNFLTGTPLGGAFGGAQRTIGGGMPPTALQATDPATAPFGPAPATAAPTPTIPGLPPIPGLPAIPGLTVPLPGAPNPAPEGGAGR